MSSDPRELVCAALTDALEISMLGAVAVHGWQPDGLSWIEGVGCRVGAPAPGRKVRGRPNGEGFGR